MPSQMTHLAVAKRYLAKHGKTIRDVQSFLDGNVLPDLNPNKAESHCGIRTEKYDVVKLNREKVNPEKFAATHDLHDDLNKGIYLHLYVDYQYYNVFLLDYFKKVVDDQESVDMYETTRRDDAYLVKKYGVAYHDSTVGDELQLINDQWDAEHYARRRRPDYKFTIPYELDAIDAFIEAMSDTAIPQ
ncbi:MAG: hypothetical protein NC133_03240 [Prevotella sp.]|nr:hypothetical protein [Prevotella sp.]